MVHGRCIGFHSGFKIELVSVSALYLCFIIYYEKGKSINVPHYLRNTL